MRATSGAPTVRSVLAPPLAVVGLLLTSLTSFTGATIPADAAPTAAATGPTAGVAHYRHVETQVFGDVAVGMPDQHTVRIQHRDPATGTWDAPSTLYATTGRNTCGGIEGQASPGGVALLVECDTPYYEDQAPAESVALVSRDLTTWATKRLPGEAYLEPAVSPSGQYAAWQVAANGEYLLWSATTGFSTPLQTSYHFDQGLATLVVDDAGTVSFLGPEDGNGHHCVVGIHTRDLAGARTHTVLPGIDPGCDEGTFTQDDAFTVTGGGYDTAHRFTLTRADAASPWTLSAVAPADAAGLVDHQGRRKRIATSFLETDRLDAPLVAIGSPDKHRVLVQTYDRGTQLWSAQTEVFASARRCRDDHYYSFEPRSLYVLALACGKGSTVLASADAHTWTAVSVGRRPWTYAGDEVALPDANGTTVVSPAGVQRFAATTRGRCDVVYPGGTGTLVRLTGSPHASWPTKVQVSTGAAFHTVSDAHRPKDRCRKVYVDNSDTIPLIYLSGARREHYPQFRLKAGVWTVTYPRNPF